MIKLKRLLAGLLLVALLTTSAHAQSPNLTGGNIFPSKTGGGGTPAGTAGLLQYNNSGAFGGLTTTPVTIGTSTITVQQGALNVLNTTPIGPAGYQVVQCHGGGDETYFGAATAATLAGNRTGILYRNNCTLDNQWILPATTGVSVFSFGGTPTDAYTVGFASSIMYAYGPGITANAPGQTAIDIHGAAQFTMEDVNYLGQSAGGLFSLIGDSVNGHPAGPDSDKINIINSSLGSGSTLVGVPTDTNQDPVQAGGVNTVTLTAPGTGYVAGTYNNVPLTGGTGTNAYALSVVIGTSGAASAVNVYSGGSATPGGGYVVGDVLSASNANLGGSGSGLQATVASIYNTPGQFNGSNFFPDFIHSSFTYQAGCAACGNISDMRAWLNTFTGGQALQLLYGGGGIEIGGNRFEDMSNALNFGGLHGNGFDGDSFVNSNYFTVASYGGGYDVQFGRGAGYLMASNLLDAGAITTGSSNSVEVGAYGATSNININGNLWVNQGAGRKYCIDLNTGFTMDYIMMVGNSCQGTGMLAAVHYQQVPTHFFELDNWQLAEQNIPIGFGTSAPLGTAYAVADFETTTAIHVPVGTTGQRPTAVEGLLRDNSTTHTIEAYLNGVWTGLGATPSGSDTQVQYNSSGSFAGSSNLTYTSGSSTLTVTNLTVSGTCTGCSGSTTNVLGTSTSATGPQKSGDATTGLYSDGVGLIKFSSSGTNELTIGTTGVNIASAVLGLQLAGANAISFPSVDSTTDGTIAIGSQAFANPSTSAGYHAIAIGEQALSGSLTTAALNNVAIGFQAGNTVTSGSQNVFIGNAANGSTTGSNNIAIGYGAGVVNVKSGSIAIGEGAQSVSGGAGVALGVGAQAGQNGFGNGPIAVGQNAGAYDQDVFIGNSAGVRGRTSGSGSVGIGFSAMAAITTASNNVAIGQNAGNKITSGSTNVILGSGVASTTLTTGANNILIGTNSGIDTPAAGTTQFLNIGNTIYGTGIGTSGTTSTGIVGIGTATPLSQLDVAGPVKTKGYTVSGLPSGVIGMRAYVTDQLTACVVAGAALTGGGAVTCPVFYNGSAWVGD